MTLLSLLGVLSSAIFSGTSLTSGRGDRRRSGIVNLGLEGVLVSASTGFAVTVVSGNPYLGTLAAMLAGVLMNMILGYRDPSPGEPVSQRPGLMFFGFTGALIGRPYVGAK
jgi:simple sugar transport system permease protein